MAPSEIIALVAYCIGILLNGIVFLIQKNEIRKLKNINGEIERYFEIVNVDSFEKLLKLKEDAFEQKVEMLSNEIALKFTSQFWEKQGRKIMDREMKKFQSKLGEQFNELGWFICEWLYELPENERDEMIKTNFPKSQQLIRDNLARMEDDDNSEIESNPDR